MDRKRVEQIAGTVGQPRSRRGFVGLGIAGLFASSAVNQAAAKKFNRCRLVRCPECAPCRKGHCRAKPDGTPCSYMNGQCLAGSCVPGAAGPPS